MCSEKLHLSLGADNEGANRPRVRPPHSSIRDTIPGQSISVGDGVTPPGPIPAGRVTILFLQMNRPVLLAIRSEVILCGRHSSG
jgi:hypothetical protein